MLNIYTNIWMIKYFHQLFFKVFSGIKFRVETGEILKIQVIFRDGLNFLIRICPDNSGITWQVLSWDSHVSLFLAQIILKLLSNVDASYSGFGILKMIKWRIMQFYKLSWINFFHYMPCLPLYAGVMLQWYK